VIETSRGDEPIKRPTEFQKEMGTREFYHHLGKVISEYEEKNNLGEVGIIAAAYRHGIFWSV
jgi:deoxyhypusine synthase